MSVENPRRLPVRRLRLVTAELHASGAFDYSRPRTRGECMDAPRPCPYTACRLHLMVDVTPRGAIDFVRPDVPFEERPTCALDEADRGPHTLEHVGAVFGLTRERIRQIEVGACEKLREAGVLDEFRGGVRERHPDPLPDAGGFTSVADLGNDPLRFVGSVTGKTARR